MVAKILIPINGGPSGSCGSACSNVLILFSGSLRKWVYRSYRIYDGSRPLGGRHPSSICLPADLGGAR